MVDDVVVWRVFLVTSVITELPDVPTDSNDPTLTDPDDPTTDPVLPQPTLVADKTVNAGADGITTPGETLTYTIVVANNGFAIIIAAIVNDN